MTTARTRLEKELERYLDILIREYRPQKVLLFGSLASGTPREGSDIDIIVVKETDKRFWDRLADVIRLLNPTEAVDILVYTPEEFEELCRDRLFFQEEILKKAKVVYEARTRGNDHRG